MPKNIELIVLSYVLVIMDSPGLGWTLVGWVQKLQKAEARAEKKLCLFYVGSF
jgi:hypothetical protein